MTPAPAPTPRPQPAPLNALHKLFLDGGGDLDALAARIRAADPAMVRTPQQLSRVITGRRGCSLPLAAALEAVFSIVDPDTGETVPRITAAEIAKLPRLPREGRLPRQLARAGARSVR